MLKVVAFGLSCSWRSMNSRPLAKSSEWPCNQSSVSEPQLLLFLHCWVKTAIKKSLSITAEQDQLPAVCMWRSLASFQCRSPCVVCSYLAKKKKKKRCVMVCVCMCVFLLVALVWLIDKSTDPVELFVYISECSAAASFIKSDEWVAHPPWILNRGQTAATSLVLQGNTDDIGAAVDPG